MKGVFMQGPGPCRRFLGIIYYEIIYLKWNSIGQFYQKLVETYSRAPLLALLFAVERIMLETGVGLDYYQDAVNEIYG